MSSVETITRGKIINRLYMILMTTLSLYLPVYSFDPADDPAVDTRLSEGTVGNSVRSFIYSATGAFMYQKYGTSKARMHAVHDGKKISCRMCVACTLVK